MTPEETDLVNQVMAENKAMKDALSAAEASLVAERVSSEKALDVERAARTNAEKALVAANKVLASAAPRAAPAGKPKAFIVKILAAGGVILPADSEATPQGMSAKVVQQPAREGFPHVDVERAIRHLAKCGHVEITAEGDAAGI